ncbi:hypothetical protein LTR56_007497 [Elasticomyces elasticus]|nr:hypothetical protein LTR56_007497 [Elasticomyces elasticus]KAK3668181.1 hypothetical protein LTR22_000866 [Elasticomyces elasticus]KAK4921373.1 hypothetical protein LTR49_011203 [Elasticomyces elasticus]KAK5769492.1 hypothetical protein LTS12_000419 [Elasticomyces elasticus]
MTAAKIKQEPRSERHTTTNISTATGSATRPMSIATTATTATPRLTPMDETNTASSGDTTVADDDVEMNGCSHNTNQASQNGAPPEDAMQVLGHHTCRLFAEMNELALLGIDATLPVGSMPKFVVVGDQSAGKSSIIEAICDITVPRDEGTCTRCPFQITTTATNVGEGWTCKISLHRSHAYTPHTVADPNDPGSYERWSHIETTEVVPFGVVHEKHLLQDVLRRAQMAILNPGIDPKAFKSGHSPTTMEVDFSPNTVSLQIEGPSLPDLSFFDLPGAVNRIGNGEKHLVAFVERLIKKYLREPNTLVLLACSANQDFETSTASRYVDECEAELRCMGVLTKPDLAVGTKRYTDIESMLNGSLFRLANDSAWFVTKQLAQEELDAGATYRDARKQEEAFFAQAPWNTTLAPYQQRFGTQAIQLSISHGLTRQIVALLPDMVSRVQASLSRVSTQTAFRLSHCE